MVKSERFGGQKRTTKARRGQHRQGVRRELRLCGYWTQIDAFASEGFCSNKLSIKPAGTAETVASVIVNIE